MVKYFHRWLWTDFTHCSIFFKVYFEQLNADWERSLWLGQAIIKSFHKNFCFLLYLNGERRYAVYPTSGTVMSGLDRRLLVLFNISRQFVTTAMNLKTTATLRSTDANTENSLFVHLKRYMILIIYHYLLLESTYFFKNGTIRYTYLQWT